MLIDVFPRNHALEWISNLASLALLDPLFRCSPEMSWSIGSISTSPQTILINSVWRYLTGAPDDQFVVKCIIIPPLMKINVIKASSRVFQCCWENIICSFFPARHTTNLALLYIFPQQLKNKKKFLDSPNMTVIIYKFPPHNTRILKWMDNKISKISAGHN